MATFKRAQEFNAWQFIITDEDMKLDDWAMEDKQEKNFEEAMGIEMRKFNILDGNQERKSRYNPFPTRFRLVLKGYERLGIYGEPKALYLEVDEGQWLIEGSPSEGILAVSDEEFKKMILP